MISPSFDYRLPRISVDTPVTRVHSTSPSRVFQKDTKPQRKVSPRLLPKQKHNKSLLDANLSSKFFFEDSPEIKTINWSPKQEKNKTYSNGILKRELKRVNERLINNELLLNKFDKNKSFQENIKHEFKIYIDYLEQVTNCLSYKYPELYKLITKAIANISHVFFKSFFLSTNKAKPEVVIKEVTEEKKHRIYKEDSCQTEDQYSSICTQYDFEIIKGISEKFKTINMPRITRKLANLHNSLLNMHTNIPKTPETPEISHDNLLKLLIKLHRPDKIIDTNEFSSQTDEVNSAKNGGNILQFNSNDQLQADLFLITQKYHELKESIEKNSIENPKEIIKNNNDSKIQELEIELMTLRSKYKNLEQINKNFKADIPKKEKIEDASKKKDNHKDKKENNEIEELKKKFGEKIHQIKTVLNISEAKLIEIEDAWLKRTGKQFVYNNKNTETSILIEEKRHSFQQVNAVPKAAFDFEKETHRKKLTITERNVKKKAEDIVIKKIHTFDQQKLEKSIIIPDNLEKKASNVIKDTKEKSIPSEKIIETPIENSIIIKNIANNTMEMNVLASNPEEKAFKSFDNNLIYKETEESYISSYSLEIGESKYEEIEEKLFKALSSDQ